METIDTFLVSFLRSMAFFVPIGGDKVDLVDTSRAAEQYVLTELPSEMLPLHEYDEVHVNVSGGVDSVATALVALHGYHIPKEKIKLVHMRVDGDPEDTTKRQLFDWPQTDGYLQYLSEFNTINAMESKDYKYIESLSKEKHSYNSKGESVFLKSANLKSCRNVKKPSVLFRDVWVLLFFGDWTGVIPSLCSRSAGQRVPPAPGSLGPDNLTQPAVTQAWQLQDQRQCCGPSAPEA